MATATATAEAATVDAPCVTPVATSPSCLTAVVATDDAAFAEAVLPVLDAAGDAATTAAVATYSLATQPSSTFRFLSYVHGPDGVPLFVVLVVQATVSLFHDFHLDEGVQAAAAALVVAKMKEQDVRIRVFLGSTAGGKHFMAAYAAAFPAAVVLPNTNTWIYTLRELGPAPEPAPRGHLRLATDADAATCASYVAPNLRDMFGQDWDTTNCEKLAYDRINNKAMYVWDVDGEIVSQACVLKYGKGKRCRIRIVYTPPAHRGHGYAPAMCYYITKAMLEEGCDTVCLHADQASKSANRVYQKVGYQTLVSDQLYGIRWPDAAGCCNNSTPIAEATEAKQDTAVCAVRTAAGSQLAVELSHPITNPMGSLWSDAAPQPKITKFWSHEQSAASGRYQNCTCELTQIDFVTSIGTHMDSPYHFHPGSMSISEMPLSSCVHAGVLVDCRSVATGGEPLPLSVLDGVDFAGKAVMICTGWSQHWGTPQYRDYPFLSAAFAQRLVDGRAALVATDALLVDSMKDPSRPAHVTLLGASIPIVEDTNNLSRLADLLTETKTAGFTFFSLPVKVDRAAAFPVRAIAILT